MNITNNRSFSRKSTYIPSLFIDDHKHEYLDNIIKYMIKKKPNKIIESNNLGLYIRPNNYDDYIDNYQTVHRNIQINSGDRNIKIYPDPFKFVTHVGNSMISFDDTGKQINTHPCIRNKLPVLKKIYLRKIIIPNNYLIIKKKISDYDYIKDIKDKIEELILSQININQTYLIDKHFFTVVNYIQNEKRKMFRRN